MYYNIQELFAKGLHLLNNSITGEIHLVYGKCCRYLKINRKCDYKVIRHKKIMFYIKYHVMDIGLIFISKSIILLFVLLVLKG